MSGTQVAGTYRLDGMLQGALPPGSPVIEEMKSWVTSAQASGLHFHLSIEGAGFSLLADPVVRKTSTIAKGGLESLLSDALDAFLKLLPHGARTSVYSTVRSEEFRRGTAVQTLYQVGPDGRIASEQRIVETETEDPPPEITAASIRRAIVPGLVVLLLTLLVSSFFIDYRKLFSEARDRIAPLAKEEVTIEQSALGKCIQVELTRVDDKRKALILQLKRGPEWQDAMNSTPTDGAIDWPTFLIHSAIHQGRLRAELYNKKGELLGSGEMMIEGLRDAESAEVAVVARLSDRLSRVVIRP